MRVVTEAGLHAFPEPISPGGALVAFPRVAVVLAAGRSDRLREVTRGGSKALVQLGGMTLVERSVRSLLAAGLEDVVVVVGHQAGAVAEEVANLEGGRVRAVYADRWEDGNGASLAAAEPELAGESLFIVACADHVFAPAALQALVRAGEPAVLTDEKPSEEAWAEGTRVRVDGGRAMAFGKHLQEPAIDCGVFLLDGDIFACQRDAAAEGDHSLAGAMSRLARGRTLRAQPLPTGSWWQDIDTPGDLRLARSALRRSLAKVSDGPVSHYLNRPISTRISMALSPLRVPPDLLSFFAFLFGLLAASFLAAGQEIVGGLLVQASSVMDGVDGETARLLMRVGPRGAIIDGVLDRMVDAAIVAGLGLWALSARFRPWTVLVLVAIALAWALVAVATKDGKGVMGLPPATERRLGYLLGGRDGRLLLVAVFAVQEEPLLAIGAMLATWLLTIVVRVVLVARTVRARSEPNP